jgi:hypothetical protein
MIKSKSSRGFSLFTPLVGTSLVIMAIIIAAGMVQNDVRISRTLTSSYEVSSQSMVAKLIKASAEVQMISNMENITYEMLSIPFECTTASSVFTDEGCDNKIEERLVETDKRIIPSVYDSLISYGGIFENIVESIDTILSGSGTNYMSLEDASDVQNRFSDLITELDEPFTIGYINEGRYYIRINSERFNENDFIVEFYDRYTRDSLKITIAPHDFAFITENPLQKLITAEKEIFLKGDYGDTDDIVERLGEELEDVEKYFVGAWLAEDGSNKRIKMEFYKGSGEDTFEIIFQTSDFDLEYEIECSYSPSGGFNCYSL